MLPLLRIRFDLFTTENRLIVWRSNCFNVSLVSPTVIFRPSSGFGRYRLFVSPPRPFQSRTRSIVVVRAVIIPLILHFPSSSIFQATKTFLKGVKGTIFPVREIGIYYGSRLIREKQRRAKNLPSFTYNTYVFRRKLNFRKFSLVDHLVRRRYARSQVSSDLVEGRLLIRFLHLR